MTEMKAEKKVDEKIDFRGPEDPKKPKASIKTKCIIGAVVFGILLASAAISLAVFFLTKPEPSKRLVDVNLEEGDTLMYRVEQRFEVTEQKLKKETITSIVGIQVVNKTTDAYWFLLKINTTFKDNNEKVKATVSGYFRVRRDHENKPPRTKTGKYKDTRNETIEAFELYGHSQTDAEFVRYLHGILYQLLPTVRRDLYEDVDGQTDDKLKPEQSPLLPGPVKMHRQADTKQSDNVLIKNHFNRSDLVNSLSRDMDVDVKYTDSAAINKSNGMVSESSVYVSEQLDFGEPIKTKDGHVITMLKATLYSHVTRIETDSSFFLEEEIKALKAHLFVRLVVLTTENIDMKKYPAGKTMPRSSNSSSLNESAVDGQRLSTQTPTTTIIRNRRALDAGNPHLSNRDATQTRYKRRARRSVAPQYQTALRNLARSRSLSVPIEASFTLFEKKVIGVNIKGSSKFWLKVSSNRNGWKLGGELEVEVGSKHVTVYDVEFTSKEVEEQRPAAGQKLRFSWSKGFEMCFPVLFLRLCAQFSLSTNINVQPPLELVDTSLNPLKFGIELSPSTEVVASAEASISAWFVSAGVYVDGTIVSSALPVKLSYTSAEPVNQWCLAASARLTAFELSAGLFYRWWGGDRNNLYSFGKYAAIKKEWQMFKKCFK